MLTTTIHQSFTETSPQRHLYESPSPQRGLSSVQDPSTPSHGLSRIQRIQHTIVGKTKPSIVSTLCWSLSGQFSGESLSNIKFLKNRRVEFGPT